MRKTLLVFEFIIKAIIAVPLATILVGVLAGFFNIQILLDFIEIENADPIAKFVCSTLAGFGIVCLWLSITARPWLSRFKGK